MTVYRWLLLFYPWAFRAEYGSEMTSVFEEKLKNAPSLVARGWVWVEAVGDVIRHAIPLHLDTLRQDLRDTGRSMRRTPGFAATVIVVAALGIGANTAVFTVVDNVLFRPLPFEDPDRLVRVWESPPGYGRMEVSPPNYQDWLDIAPASFESMAAYSRSSANVIGRDQPERLLGTEVKVGMFDVLGRRPMIGTAFEPGDDVFGAGQKIILSYALWQRSFGGDASVLGQSVALDDVPHVIVGVMPQDFMFPDSRGQYWKPLQISEGDGADRNNNYLEVVARLNEGVSRDEARVEMQQVMAQLELEYPAANEDNSASVNLLTDEVPRQSRLLLLALIGGALCVLLITCTNLANLLLARAMSRRQEMAVRSSLGAGRERLIKQLMTESLTFALLGGIGGVLLAYAVLPFLARLVPATVPVATALSFDIRVLGFAFVATALTGIGFGALPAWRVGRSTATGLRDSDRVAGGRKDLVRSALVIAEVGACVVLLVVSGLLVRALNEVRATEPGFEAEGVMTARTWLPRPRYTTTDSRTEFYARVLDELRSTPGVENAAYTSFLPIVMGGGIWPVDAGQGEVNNRSGNYTASLRFVTSGYFETLGIPVLQGRGIEVTDDRSVPPYAVVSQSFVDRFWPDQDPIGRAFNFAFAERIVIGVVGDVRMRGLERQNEPQVYLPHEQVPDGGLSFYAPKDLAVKYAGDAGQVASIIQTAVQRADPSQPVMDLRTMQAILDEDTASRDVQLRVLGAFAALAFLLAAIGIHGLLSFATSMRTREIGVRMALGAEPRSILQMFVREGVMLAAVGVAAGALGGYLAGRSLRALLFGVAPLDPMTFIVALGLALTMTLLGSLPPALRAAALDPNAVLREG